MSAQISGAEPADPGIESGTRARTRRAILDAAVEVLGQRPAASLGEVADTAGVGRSTLHRYFPDRAALVEAIFTDTIAVMTITIEEAALDQGSAREALSRLVPAFFEVGSQMTFLFNELREEQWENPALERSQWPVGALIARGQASGEFDTDLDLEWIIRLIWHLMPAGWEAVDEGVLRKHEAIAALVRTLEKILWVPAGPDAP